MGWSTILAGLTVVSVVLMLTACSMPRYYPLTEPLSPALTRVERPEPYTGSPQAVSCHEGWCF